MGTTPSHELTAEELDELKESTHFTSKEIREWYDKFYEDYPGGQIDQEAFTQMYQNLFPNGNPAEFAKQVFRSYDADNNGFINFHEFITTLSVSLKGTVDEKLKWSFRLYDLDKDGTVSRQEAIQIISAIYKLRGEYDDSGEKAEYTVETLFISLDKNQDDLISEVEFVLGAKHSQQIMMLLSGS